jgi:ribosomal protein L16/L10AE
VPDKYLEALAEASDRAWRVKPEQVDLEYATVADLREHAQIHLRKAAQASSKANDEAKAADEAFRRAKGNLSKRLRELADE